MMRNINSKQNINGAGAPGRGFSSAPWNICCNTFLTAKEVLDAKSEQSGCSPLAESGADAPQSGRSMIEMLGVLAIIGVLSVGGIAGYSKAMQKYRINKTIEQITLIAGNVRAFFAPQKNYDEVSNKNILKKAKLVPDEMWDGSRIYHEFGGSAPNGDIYIWAESKSESGDNKAFTMRIQNLPVEACIEIISYDWNGVSSGLIAIGTNQSDLKKYHVGCSGFKNENDKIACAGGSVLSVPIPTDIAVEACTHSSLVTLKFY